VTDQEVRRLVRSGELIAQRIGTREWAIDEDSIAQRVARRPSPGRPWTPAVSWAALWQISGLPVDWLPRTSLSRLRRRIRERNPYQLAAATATRANLEYFVLPPSELGRLRAESGIVTGGGPPLLNLYCDPATRHRIDSRYDLLPATRAAANLALRTTRRPQLWPRVPADAMPAGIAAVDLLDSPLADLRQAGHDQLSCLVSSFRS
jgi:hypothetical protein